MISLTSKSVGNSSHKTFVLYNSTSVLWEAFEIFWPLFTYCKLLLYAFPWIQQELQMPLQGTRINVFRSEVFFKVVILKQLIGSQILIACASLVMFWWTISSGVLFKDEGRIEKKEGTTYMIIQFLKWHSYF